MFRFLCDAVRRMGRDERGNVFVLFGAAAIPLLLIMGGAIDLARFTRYKAELANTVDAAALALARDHFSYTAAQAKDFVNDYVNAHGITDDKFGITSISVTKLSNGFRVTTDANMKTIFLPLTGFTAGGKPISGMAMDIVSEVATESKRLEVAIVLDNSGSMAGTKLSTLKDAATSLVSMLYDLGDGSSLTDPVKIGLVPFAASVNVGSTYASASWMDTGAKGTYHGDAMEANGASSVNNFTLFSSLKDSSGNAISWGGCVEARPMPYDVQDDAPSTASSPTTTQKKTLFVPMFAPDEPDNWTCSTSSCSYNGSGSARRYNGAPSGSKNDNNYLPDAGTTTTCGSASSTNSNWTCANGTANCNGSNNGRSETVAFAGNNLSSKALCKYGTSSSKATTSSITVGGIPGGPNFMCTTQALQPLTTNESSVLSKISAMEAEGATSIVEGAMWGWRILSPGEPFTQGAAYDTNETNKVLVLMTDGRNTYYPNSYFTKSWYDTYGYVAMNHMGTTSTNSSTLSGVMDDRTELACTNIKAAGIVIYTVGFDISGSDAATALGVLENCASSTDKFYKADDDEELLSVFNAIGNSISNLHLTK
jgi:Flp pilus assembly protein TadG